jgi:ABC-type phosphate transport system substrate-binding protein
VRALRSIAVAGAALASLAAGITAASADPTATPATTDIVAVGSDTIQSLFDQFSTDYNATSPTHKLYSYEATGSSTITTKNNDANCTITRPNGSGAGISQLTKNLKTADNNPCVDIARASRNIKSSDGTGLAAVQFARDLITYSYVSGGHAVTNLTTAQLTAIYNCSDATLGGSGTPVTWNEVGGTSTDAIVPVLPQASSGTRSTWLADIGVTWTTAPSCIVNGASSVDSSVIEENEGTNSEFTTANANAADVVFPFSAGDYVGEVYTLTNPQSPGSLVLGSINSTAPLTSSHTINVAGFSTAYIRTLFAVVLSSGASPWVPSYLQPLLGASNNSGWICKGSSSTAGTGPYDTAQAGFAPITGLTCGAVTHQ